MKTGINIALIPPLLRLFPVPMQVLVAIQFGVNHVVPAEHHAIHLTNDAPSNPNFDQFPAMHSRPYIISGLP
ncbi:hypothetical protein P8452_20944 [Trifolium repens]|jgi:hypothetical protein|nr:hypothetical protein P8452_20944 [Trifolium repens]